jgi:hypothetical protein
MWFVFAYLIIPMGAALTVMLISGLQSPVDLAKTILSSPFRIYNAQVSAALVLTAFCGIMVGLSYSGLKRAEHMLEQSRNTFMMVEVEERLMKNKFLQGRNFWMSLLGLALWGVAWRLKTLFDSRTLTVNRLKRKSNSLASRASFVVMALLCLAAADVPLCRLNYSLQLMTFVTPAKDRLMDFSKRNRCENAFLASAQGECARLCADTRKLSDDRLWAVTWARDWHLFGRLAAKFFDDLRNVEQGAGRIDKLFEDRTCERVLLSIDKSNTMVNIFCGLFAGVSILGFLVAIQNILSDSADPFEATNTPAVGVTMKKD